VVFAFAKEGGAAPVSGVEPGTTRPVSEEDVMELMGMGFDEATVRDALQSAGDKESAVMRILG
jgi:hypothetical protein